MDAEAEFEALYRAHCGALRSFVHRRVSGDGADEIVAEVFVAAWRRMDDVPEDGLVWLFGIARGLIANRRRSDHRRQALHDRLAATAVTRIDPGPDARAAEIDAVLLAFASLSERDQELLRLIAWEGLKPAQVATVLGITSSLVSLRLHRARHRFAQALARNEPTESHPDTPSPTEVFR